MTLNKVNGKFANVNNTKISAKKTETGAKTNNDIINMTSNGNTGKQEVSNNFDLLTPGGFYAGLGVNLSTHSNVDNQIEDLVGSKVMATAANTSTEIKERIGDETITGYDKIIDLNNTNDFDTQTLLSLAGMSNLVNAPNLETTQETLNNSAFVSALFS